MQQELGIEVELVGHDTARELWPTARLDDFAEFAYEPRGGYGDGHQTAMAFAVCRPPRRGAPAPALRRGRARRAGRPRRRSRPGGRQPRRRRPCRAGGGPLVDALASTAGVDLPVRAQRAQILLIDPGRPVAPVPVFSDLVSLQYVRTEGTGLLLGDSDHSDPEWSEPDGYRERVSDDELAVAVPKFARRFPGLDDAALALFLCRLLRRHARLQPRDRPVARRGPLAVRGLLGTRLQDLALGG